MIGGGYGYNFLPTDGFQTIGFTLGSILLIYVFIKIKIQSKRESSFLNYTDLNKLDLLLQPKNEEITKVEPNRLPFTNYSFSFTRFFLWGMVLLLSIGASLSFS